MKYSTKKKNYGKNEKFYSGIRSWRQNAVTCFIVKTTPFCKLNTTKLGASHILRSSWFI